MSHRRLLRAIRLHKYASRYATLRSSNIIALLWLLGEVTARIRHLSELSDERRWHPRTRAALRALLNFHRDPLTPEQVRTLMREAVAHSR